MAILTRKKHRIPTSFISVGEYSVKDLILQAAIKAFLLCLCVIGIFYLAKDFYKIPTNDFDLIKSTIIPIVLFTVLFILVKFRFAFPLIGLVSWIALDFEKVTESFKYLFNYILYALDGRLLATAQFATIAEYRMHGAINIEKINYAFILFMIAISLFLSVMSRARFIGGVLITALLVIIPAIAAEIAFFSFGFVPLLSGIFGLYSIWTNQGSEPFKSPKRSKQGRLKIMGGFQKNNVNITNAIASVLIAAFAIVIANGIMTEERVNVLRSVLDEKATEIAEFATDTFTYVKSGGGWANDNGYFASSTSISDMIELSAPNRSTRPVLNVTKGDNKENLYLRASIGVDYVSKSNAWSVNKTSNNIGRLNELLEDFYPEFEYVLFENKVSKLGVNPANVIGFQQVTIDYLLKTNFALVPNAPVDYKYKSSGNFNFFLDTTLTTKNNAVMGEHVWSTYYPKLSEMDYYNVLAFSEESEIMDVISRLTESSLVINTEFDINEYFEKYKKYQELVYDIYTVQSGVELENMNRFYDELIHFNKYVTPTTATDWALLIKKYFHSDKFTYSLDTDNMSGENTMLGNFLFDTHSGHCALYATSATLLLRTLGVPARYVTGYVAAGEGTFNAGNYSYTILEKDLHAWVEVFYDGLGWVPYDVTPPSSENALGSPAATEEPIVTSGTTSTTTSLTDPTSESEITTTTTETEKPQGESSHSEEVAENAPKKEIPKEVFIAIAVALFVMLLLGAMLLFIKRVNIRAERLYKKLKTINDRATARRAYRLIMNLLSLENITRRVDELPTDFAERISALDIDIDLKSVMGIFEKLEFSREGLTADEFKAVSTAVTTLYNDVIEGEKGVKKFMRKLTILSTYKNRNH